MRVDRSLVALVVAAFLGVAVAPTRAQQNEPPKDEKKDEKKPEKPAPEKKKKVHRPFAAKVKDRYNNEFEVATAFLWVPEVSLLGGESGDEKQVFTVKKGAAEIEIPFEDVESVEFPRDAKEDRLPIVIVLRDPELKKKLPKGLEGDVKASLQLWGDYEGSKLQAKLKLKELRSIQLELREGK